MQTIAIVEPDDIIALDIASTVERAGLASAEIFQSTQEALRRVHPSTHSLILIDIGDDQQQEIEAAIDLRRTRGMRCLIFSDHTMSRSLPKLRDAEPLGFLVKPFSSQELLAIVESALYRATMEERLQASEHRYRNLFQYSLSARCIADQRGAILERNGVFEKSFTAARVRQVQQIFPEEFDWEDMLDTARRSEILHRELRTRDLGDGSRDIICSASPLRGPSGASSVAIEIVDITELKRTREALFQAQKQEEIGRITSGVAHDLNNFLTSMLGFLEIMKLDIPESPALRDDIGGIERAIQKTSTLTKQLLGFSRRKSFEPRPFDLREVITDSAKMMRRLIPENIALALSLPDNPVVVLADVGHVEQILLNLVVNARDALANAEAPRIEVRLSAQLAEKGSSETAGSRAQVSHARIDIVDNGCGIEKSVRERLFEPYFTTKEAGKGTGLGLAIVKSLTEMNGGWLSLESSVGRGSVFSVSIPLYLGDRGEGAQPERPGASSASPEASSAGDALSKRRILIVDDDVSVLESCARTLRRAGAEIRACADAAEALAASESATFDLVVSDLVLPLMTGAELWGALSTKSKARSCLFITGYESSPSAEKYPGIEVLYKPFEPSELVRACVRALKL